MSRDGFALVFVLLIVAAIELLTLSSLSLATHEALVADAQIRTRIAEYAADAALARLANDWPTAKIDSLLVGEHVLLTGVRPGVAVSVSRVAWGFYLASAETAAGRATIRREAVLRTLDPQRASAESTEAVVSAGPLVITSSELSVDDSVCATPFPRQRTPVPVTVSNRQHAIGLRDARIDSAHAVLPAGYALGGVRWTEVASIADRQVRGTVELPVDTMGATAYPLLFAEQDLEITGGSGQGLLFVNGNLRMRGDVRFTGIIVVGGAAHISGGVAINGVLRVHSTQPSFLDAVQITYSRCVVARALLETPSAARLIRAHRFYIPAF